MIDARALAAMVAAYLVLPFLVNGVIVRTKARWAGRKGPPLFQLLFDVRRLLRKDAVRSTATTPVFVVGAWTTLATSLAAALFVPTLFRTAACSFRFDFVALAYVYGLGRVWLMLTALDTASSFEGMGASREATFSALAEPALFFALGTLTLLTPERTLAGLLSAAHTDSLGPAFVALCAVTLFILLQVETARLPVDDPNTHLELTMIHEVMILDHSGPELAAVQLGSAVKMTTLLFMIASLVNPARGPAAFAAWALALVIAFAILLAFVESAIARFRLSAVPRYVLVGAAASALTLVLGVLLPRGMP
ncbi:MAG TPA: NADH-quinone oxidoreductase subunit H [bacterium]|nr:NADH-quinone oxidoreductase subunit H [bacterium]